MRNTALTIAILFCLATASMATDQKESSAQSNQEQQTKMARKGGDGYMHDASCAQTDCVPRPEKQSKPDKAQHDPEGDPQASQNQVEYGGGG